jgi:glycosyltransferase involved in cell wall biosynthesis
MEVSEAPTTDATRERPLRVLMVHNRYGAALPSGENLVVDDEVELLRSAGVEVEPFVYDSSDIEHYSVLEKLELVTRPIHSPRVMRDFRRVIARHRPDVVHIHNVYPLISPSIVNEAKRAGLPVVVSLHNYRLGCANGLFFRDGAPCYECAGKAIPYPSVLHGCYRGSRQQSGVISASLALHRNTWRNVDRFFVLQDHAARFLRSLGIAPDRIIRKANPVEGPESVTYRPGRGLLYAGRLEVAKGTAVLLDAWERSGLGETEHLTLIGDGPLRKHVEHRVTRLRNVRYLGRLPRDEVFASIEDHAAVVLASLSLEGFPLLMVEAFARGRPAIAHNVGGLPWLLTDDTGWVSEADARSLAETMRKVFDESPDDAEARGRRCRALYEARCSPPKVAETLIATYTQLVASV